jgi:hypothetical protein
MKRRTVVLGVLGLLSLGAAAYARLRVLHLHWGATPEEVHRSLPFDDRIPDPTYVTTRAVTIEARPSEIWPWLVQMGELPRGGFYSYTWVETLLGMHIRNVNEILPQFQTLDVGTSLDRAGGLTVRAAEENQYIVLGPRLTDDGVDATWLMLLEPVSEKSTRLVSRVHARLPRNLKGLFLLAVLDPGQFIMERKWLLGVKERAETLQLKVA